MGTGYNDDFFSLDGGNAWRDPVTGCGDCDAWYADIAQHSTVLSFGPRETDGGFNIFRSGSRFYPTPDSGIGLSHVPCPSGAARPPDGPCNVHSYYALKGYRPIVQTLANESVDPDPDVMVIQFRPDGSRALLRSSHIASIVSPNDWLDTSKAVQVGPLLPSNVDVVQGVGGHSAPVFYVGDPSSSMSLWKWSTGMAGWTRVVPGGAAGSQATTARRYFADPYNANVVYVVDSDAIKRSDDGGGHWIADTGLTTAATERGTFSLSGDGSILKDMIFDRFRPSLRVAICNSGVFFSRDGQRWERLLSTTALNGHLVSGYLDSVTNASRPTVYVAIAGRGVLSMRIPPSPSNA
jgi:hypothetical protein